MLFIINTSYFIYGLVVAIKNLFGTDAADFYNTFGLFIGIIWMISGMPFKKKNVTHAQSGTYAQRENVAAEVDFLNYSDDV